MLHTLMRPSNAVCDALGVTDEHERGMIRMLVNMMVFATVGATALFAAWSWMT